MTDKLAMAMLFKYDFLFQVNCFLVACKTFAMAPKNRALHLKVALLKVWGIFQYFKINDYFGTQSKHRM